MHLNNHEEVLKQLALISPADLAYVAAPYTARLADGSEDKVTVANRVREMSLCMEKLMRMGIKTCSPLLMHLLRTYVNDLPGDWQYWGDYSRVMLQRCDKLIVLMIDGWDRSTGVEAEIDLWITAGLGQIIYIDPKALLETA